MKDFLLNKVENKKQYLYSILLVLIVSGVCYGFRVYIGYHVVALLLLVTVSAVAISFDIFPVLIAAFLSAIIWDFFFIPPRFNFHVSTTEDSILLITYFMIALVNAALTFRIRQLEKASRKKEERANAIKLYNTLLNSLSHELRTPISTIIAATDNLHDNADHLSKMNKEMLVAEISKASFRLNEQVGNLLNMSRLESGIIKPKNDWTDINELIYSLVRKFEGNHVRQRISININPDLPLFKTDKGMLEQIIYNLVNNACLYTAPQTTINISAMRHADVLQLVIEDNGKGFPADEIGNVFEIFYRLRNTKTGGTGLGLSIVKGFAEALKGTVQLTNVDGGGSKFIIEIPCKISYLKV